MQELVLQAGIEPGLPALGAWSLSHGTTGEVPQTVGHSIGRPYSGPDTNKCIKKNSYEKKFMAFEATETLNTDLIFDDNKELLLILVVTMVLWICFLKILIL